MEKEQEQEITKCQRCGVDGEGDLRTLWHSCFYEMGELKLPFHKTVMFEAETKDLSVAKESTSIDIGGGRKINLAPPRVKSNGELIPMQFYCLRVCKDCRADWLHAIKKWFSMQPEREEIGSGIYVRDFGTSKEITREEWDRRQQEKV